MIVISDTTTVNYLILIDAVRILPALYEAVIAPEAVLAELRSPFAPQRVQRWANALPAWLEVKEAAGQSIALDPRLGAGERDAIALAYAAPDGLLLIDELRGRREAVRLGVRVLGTLGVLRNAHTAGLLDFTAAMEKLRATSFQVSEELSRRMLISLTEDR